MSAALSRLARWFAVLGGLCAGAVALMVVVSIAGRALWSRPIQGDIELTQFGIALCISLCLPWAQVQRANIIVDFFTQKAGPAVLRGLDGLGAVLLALMVALLAWRTAVGAQAVREAHEATMILDLPMWWAYALLAPGLALTAVVALVQAFTGMGATPEEHAA
ncbi:TRAP transporter small permease [Sphaerotilus sp.]|jgi:TRAP-type C4-dicarboxylate transport system permease small subunit|uniref:TRAP transporter small permease n=1 Tax=Sphaerotilus sp. TaxID=2093942 RepID=UPI0025D9785D|nr:TRAP transporter small permease [Sphaerotilus sp.]